jgi:hypothetical protein
MEERLEAVRIGDTVEFAYGKGYAQGECVGWKDDPRLGRCVLVYNPALCEIGVPLAHVLCRYRAGKPTITFEHERSAS